VTYKKILVVFFILSLILWTTALFKKGKLPEVSEILPPLYQDPVQTEVKMPPFIVQRKGIVYTITPLFSYELYGLIVSNHSSKEWFDYYHKSWKDYLNAKDICVVWGQNVKNGVYLHGKFTNDVWTCNYRFPYSPGNTIFASFNPCCLSNNHLLFSSDTIYRAMMESNRGDQIYLRGFLVTYAHGTFRRGSSTTRTDQGNGACETIYVTDYRILKKANPLWRNVYAGAKYSMITCALLLVVIQFMTPIKFHLSQP